ncbi:MAG: transposase [bacterium]
MLQNPGVSEQTFHRWRNQCGGMMSAEAKRLKELEVENGRSKGLIAEKELDISSPGEAKEYPGNPQAPRIGGW